MRHDTHRQSEQFSLVASQPCITSGCIQASSPFGSFDSFLCPRPVFGVVVYFQFPRSQILKEQWSRQDYPFFQTKKFSIYGMIFQELVYKINGNWNSEMTAWFCNSSSRFVNLNYFSLSVSFRTIASLCLSVSLSLSWIT